MKTKSSLQNQGVSTVLLGRAIQIIPNAGRALYGNTKVNQQNLYNNHINRNPEWIAGFVDAEGFFSIHFHKNKNSYIYTFGIRINVRDRHVLEKIQQYFGVGNIYEDKTDNTVRYLVSSKSDLEKIIYFFTHIARLRSKKARNFILFETSSQNIKDKTRIAQIIQLNSILSNRPFYSRIKLTPNWILGFLEGDGAFLVNIRKKQKLSNGLPVIHCSLNIVQKELNLLNSIVSHETNMGQVAPKSNSATNDLFSYDIGKLKELEDLIKILDSCETWQSNAKYHDYIIWKKVIELMKNRPGGSKAWYT